jgi:hypothetical protein
MNGEALRALRALTCTEPAYIGLRVPDSALSGRRGASAGAPHPAQRDEKRSSGPGAAAP